MEAAADPAQEFNMKELDPSSANVANQKLVVSQVTSSTNSEYKDMGSSLAVQPLAQGPILNELSDNYYHGGQQQPMLGHEKPHENVLAPPKTSQHIHMQIKSSS